MTAIGRRDQTVDLPDLAASEEHPSQEQIASNFFSLFPEELMAVMSSRPLVDDHSVVALRFVEVQLAVCLFCVFKRHYHSSLDPFSFAVPVAFSRILTFSLFCFLFSLSLFLSLFLSPSLPIDPIFWPGRCFFLCFDHYRR